MKALKIGNIFRVELVELFIYQRVTTINIIIKNYITHDYNIVQPFKKMDGRLTTINHNKKTTSPITMDRHEVTMASEEFLPVPWPPW